MLTPKAMPLPPPARDGQDGPPALVKVVKVARVKVAKVAKGKVRVKVKVKTKVKEKIRVKIKARTKARTIGRTNGRINGKIISGRTTVGLKVIGGDHGPNPREIQSQVLKVIPKEVKAKETPRAPKAVLNSPRYLLHRRRRKAKMSPPPLQQ